MHKQSKKLSLMFSLLIFLTLTLTLLLTGILAFLLFQTGLFIKKNQLALIIIASVISILVGTLLSKFAVRHPLAAIISLSQAAKEIAAGNFNLELQEDAPVDELRDLAHNFNIMTKELAGTEILRGDFIENVSHEFKTPLAAIEGYATLLQKPGLNVQKQEEYTKKILYNTKRLSALTSNILLLSSLEHQKIGIQKETFCLDEQLREVILLLEELWAEKEIELEIDLDSADYYGNKDLLAHVWQNILGNAIKFAPQMGRIRILLSKEKGGIKIHIVDNGIGISEEIQPRIFEKFYQGDRSRASQGNGLGLSLAKRIVDLHDGKISVSSKEGKGTTFTVDLPTIQRGMLP